MRVGSRVGLGLIAFLAIVAAASSGTATTTDTDASCRFVGAAESESGKAELQITISDYVGELGISRHGQLIEVGDPDTQPLDPINCGGDTTPTVRSVDQVIVRAPAGELDSFTVDLRGGPLAPGATPEPDGTEEIEVSLEQSRGTVLAVVGTRADDYVQLGAIGGGRYGANLNASDEGDPDADVSARIAAVAVLLGKGDDRVNPRGTAAYATGPFEFVLYALGRAGNDLLIGTDRRDYLVGGGGRDRLEGAGARDRLNGGAGPDHIDARDDLKETVECGRGTDSVLADRVDDPLSCERQYLLEAG